MKSQFLLFTFFICLMLNLQAQDTIKVPMDFDFIQEAIDEAVDGDVVLVDTGIYKENIQINWKSIIVTSNYINTLDSADIYNTVIDGSTPGNPNIASTVSISASDTNTVICGFTIRNGSGTLIINRGGGGVKCWNNGKIIHNRIIENSVYSEYDALGGGIWAEGSNTSNFIIRHNIIENNSLENASGADANWGAAIGVYQGNVIIANNIIRSNEATGRAYGAGIYCNRCSGLISGNLITGNIVYHEFSNRSRGGGMYLVNCRLSLEIVNNDISHNEFIYEGYKLQTGGGIAILNTGGFENTSILVQKNIISDNVAYKGGGVSLTDIYNIEFSNNVIRDNESEGDGAGLYFEDYGEYDKDIGCESHDVSQKNPENRKIEYFPVLVNNNITGNVAEDDGGGLAFVKIMDYVLFNNIIYDNMASSEDNEIYIGTGNDVFLSHNNINTDEITGNGSWQGEVNIDVDPCFDTDGYHLLANSGCINEGVESVVLNDNEFFAPADDIDGESRPQYSYLDMGVDEVTEGVSVDEVSRQNEGCLLNYYPNPCEGWLNLQYQVSDIGYLKFEMFSINGQRVKQIMSQKVLPGKYKMEVDVSSLKPGIYFVKVHAGKDVEVRKLIIQ